MEKIIQTFFKLNFPFVAVVLSIAIILLLAFIKIIDRRFKYLKQYKKIRYHISKGIATLVYSLVLLLVVRVIVEYKQSIADLSILLGFVGAGITFALQEVILSIAGWLGIIFGRFYRVGHRIKLDNIVGDVIDIGIFRTTLMECGNWVDGDLYNGRIVRIANSFVYKEPVFNYTSDFNFLWDEIKLHLKHNSDYEQARDIIVKAIDKIETIKDNAIYAKEQWEEISNKYFVENAQTAPLVHFSVDRNGIEFTIRYVVDPRKRRSLRDEILTIILLELRNNGIRPSIAEMSFYAHEPIALDINQSNQLAGKTS